MGAKKRVVISIKSVLNKLPYVSSLYRQSLNCCYPNGHYYSPVFSREDVINREEKIWKRINENQIQAIDLNLERQKELVLSFEKFYHDLPFKDDKQENTRFYYNNSYYTHTDSIVLYSMIRKYRPEKIIEVGSGFSSMVMLDVNNLFFDDKIDITFIEPFPERLKNLLNETDKGEVSLLEKDVQDISLETFKSLKKGDILFIDSTHVSKTGSDVNYIFFEIFPVLKKGVLIHFHDIFYPFEYPKEWVFKGINWNEAYMLRSFLMYNNAFEIKFFSQFLHRFYKDVFKNMPICYKGLGSSFWIEKQ